MNHLYYVKKKAVKKDMGKSTHLSVVLEIPNTRNQTQIRETAKKVEKWVFNQGKLEISLE